MVEARKETTKEAEIKKQLEAIAGRKIDLNADALIKQLSYYVSIQSRVDNCSLRKESAVFPVHTCEVGAAVLDVHGFSSTGGDGKIVLSLREFICVPVPSAIAFSNPASVVATPRSEGPVFLTTSHVVTPANFTDVQITVFAWNTNGQPAPDVHFDWHCRAHINAF
jgi:hypothetical protein